MPRRGQRLSSGVTLLLLIVGALACDGCGSDPPAAGAKSGSPAVAADGSAASPSAEPSSAESSTAGAATAQAPATATAKRAATPTTIPPPKPSPEQLSQWAISDDPPLQLFACYDGFSDSAVQCLALAPDGKQFVLGGAKLTLWDTATPQPKLDLLAKYKGDEVERPVRAVGISPNGELLAAGDQSGKLRIWQLSDQSEVVSIQAQKGHLTELAFSPDSRLLATTSYSGEVVIWQAADGKQVQSFKAGDQEIPRLAFLTDGLLVTAGRDVQIWDAENGTKQSVLTKGHVTGPALGLSPDRQRLAFNDSESQTQLWDVQKGAASPNSLRRAAAHLIEFSPDGKLIATAGASQISIWNASRGNAVQVIDTEGGRTVALKWLPENRALMVASEQGRVRFWGTAGAAAKLGIEPLSQPVLASKAAGAKRSLSSARFEQIIDVRSFPQLPESVPMWGDAGIFTYNAPVSQKVAELFYRYCLGKAGWAEMASAGPSQPGLYFHKEGCELNISMYPASESPGTRAGDLQIGLHFAGNYDVRWLPRISPIDSPSTWQSFASASFRTRASLTDVEVAVLKLFHEAGWTAYTRLNAASAEDPLSRNISMLQGGSVLTVSIGHPADSTDELVVQTSVNISHKSLPIPPDAGWIEFDSSTDLALVANTSMNLTQTIEYFDREMAAEGWLSREAGRHIDEEKHERAWLPYIRGQQDVLLRLAALPEGKTRIVVGDAERSSWQLQTNAERTADASTTAQAGLEAADFELPKGASSIRFDVDQKKIEFELSKTTAKDLAEQFIKQLEALDWTREGAGIISDDYVFITYKKGKKEIQLRGRPADKKPSAMISGDGLLWSKPLPAAPVRISYETWLRRNHKPASLDQLDEFAAEMQKIPAGSQKKN